MVLLYIACILGVLSFNIIMGKRFNYYMGYIGGTLFDIRAYDLGMFRVFQSLWSLIGY